MFFQFDRLKRQGFHSTATSDARSAAEIAIHILSAHMHIDRLPKARNDDAEQQRRDAAERAVRGWWRQVDFGKGGYLRQGRSAHERELASWLALTGWAVQATRMEVSLNGEPWPIADLLDPSSVYPLFEGPHGELSALYYLFTVSGARLKHMALSEEIAFPGDIDDDEVVSIMDYWEERYNSEDTSQNDILNTLHFSVGNQGIFAPSSGGWGLLRDTENFSPNSVGQQNGFAELPFNIVHPGNTPIAGSYEASQIAQLGKTAGGLLLPMKETWEEANKWMSMLLEEISKVITFDNTIQVASPTGLDILQADELGEPKSTFSDTKLSLPFTRSVETASAMEFVYQQYRRMMQKLTVLDESIGLTESPLSGVALKLKQEASRVNLQPYGIGMEHMYAATGKTFLDEFKRRFQRASKREVRLQGRDIQFGYSDEVFSVSQVPDSTFMESKLQLALPEDDMMKANIFRTLGGPNARLSLTELRENVMTIQDLGLEEERLARDNVEQSTVWINNFIAERLFDEAEAAEQDGNSRRATVFALGAQALMMSLIPEQGQGIPERPGQGSPTAGGTLANNGGGLPELSPANRPSEPGQVAAPAGAGAGAQAQRNLRGR